jgi:hypothetical protein
MNILDKRWNYCKQIFEKLIEIQKNNNYMIYVPWCTPEQCDIEGINFSLVEGNFYISDNELGIEKNENLKYIIFKKDKDLDNGYHTPLYKWKKWFKMIKFYEIKKINL